MRRNAVIGQTGRKIPLSDETIRYEIERKRTLRFKYEKMKGGWMAWICEPFHSRLYGIIGLGYCGPVVAVHIGPPNATRLLSVSDRTKRAKAKAKVALKARLADDFGYTGHLMLSVIDGSDTVGIPQPRLLDDGARNVPITTKGL